MAASRSLRRKMMLFMCILLDTEDDPPSRRARQRWMREWIQQRTVQGIYNNLLREFELADEASYYNYLRMGKNTFNILLAKVQSRIEKNDTNFRRSISVGERLAITLRFLATGESYKSLHYQFRVGDRTISYIISETCHALYNVLKDDYLQVPKSEDEWMKVANGFERRWNLPHCVGALDGKHIVIKAPTITALSSTTTRIASASCSWHWSTTTTNSYLWMWAQTEEVRRICTVCSTPVPRTRSSRNSKDF